MKNYVKLVSTSTSNKFFKGVIETFGEVIALRYNRVDLNKYFDVFCEKIINYSIKEINNDEGVLVLIKGLKEPKSLFAFNNNTKDLTAEEEKSEVNKTIMSVRVRQYIKREARLYSNMNNIYCIMWVQCTQGIKSVLKGNKYYNKVFKTLNRCGL